MYSNLLQPDRRQTLMSGFALSLGAVFSDRAYVRVAAPVDQVWQDARRQREVPVRIRWPSDALPMPAGGWPVVLFSHGLGGTRAGGEVWGHRLGWLRVLWCCTCNTLAVTWTRCAR